MFVSFSDSVIPALYAGKKRLFVERYILRTMEAERLQACMIEELFERDYTVFGEN